MIDWVHLEQMSSAPDWDDDHGLPIPHKLWDDAKKLVSDVATRFPFLGEPFVGPCGDESVHVNWHAPGWRSFGIEIRDGDWWWHQTLITHDDPRDADCETYTIPPPEAIRRLKFFCCEEGLEPEGKEQT